MCDVVDEQLALDGNDNDGGDDEWCMREVIQLALNGFLKAEDEDSQEAEDWREQLLSLEDVVHCVQHCPPVASALVIVSSCDTFGGETNEDKN